MHAPRPRHVVRLRLTLIGIEPAIWRDLVIDRSASLGELHEAIQVAFGADRTDHHMFVDRRDESEAHHAPWGGQAPSARRWGDRWTMIDLRDPTVHDEKSVTVAQAILTSNPLFYSWRADDSWWCRIDAFEDDVLEPGSPRTALKDGGNRSPLRDCPDPATYDTWLRVLEAPGHEDHADLREILNNAVGPWATFDPAEFIVADARSEIEERFAGSRGARDREHPIWNLPPLESLIQQFPSSNQRGLRRHVRRSGVLMPAVVTGEEAALLTRPFRWVVQAAADDGIRMLDGSLPPSLQEDGAEMLGCGVKGIPPLLAAARQLGLIYPRLGRLYTPRRAADTLSQPLALWQFMAQQLLRRRMAGTDVDANTLFVLAIADGSLASRDSDSGMSRIAAAIDTLYSARRSAYRNSRVHGDDRYDRYRDPLGGYDLDVPPYDRWLADRRSTLTPSDATDAARESTKTQLLTRLAPIIDTLAPLGLGQDAAGVWLMPGALREFARTALA